MAMACESEAPLLEGLARSYAQLPTAKGAKSLSLASPESRSDGDAFVASGASRRNGLDDSFRLSPSGQPDPSS